MDKRVKCQEPDKKILGYILLLASTRLHLDKLPGQHCAVAPWEIFRKDGTGVCQKTSRAWERWYTDFTHEVPPNQRIFFITFDYYFNGVNTLFSTIKQIWTWEFIHMFPHAPVSRSAWEYRLKEETWLSIINWICKILFMF